jgi:acyl-CoA reductase-like NAD-dependent aldehyde dehydrogenase
MSIDWIGRSQTITPLVQNFIDGRRRASAAGVQLQKYSPRDGRLLCTFGAGDARVVDEAVANARRAFEDGRWSKLPVQRRKDVLHKLASLIERHHEELALLECIDVGKPISDALHIDVPLSAASIRYSAEAADKFSGKVYAADRSGLSYQLHRPIGVVAGIVGWNFPLVLAASKIGPALATGNSLVLKPSEVTSFSAARVAELGIEAGVPEGVLNVVHGGGDVGAALAHHRDVDMVAFTGSTHTGRQLLVASGQSNMKRLVLECGGKAPNIVFDDCPDLEAVADAVVARAFWNQGQVCTASSRLLIQHSLKDEFLRILIRKSAALHPADPLSPDTKYGAVVSRSHQQKILDYIRHGASEGARPVYQSNSKAPFENGFYVSPVIFDSVSPQQKIAQEEIFGPVLSVMSFRDEEDALRIANSTIYGLSAIIWTKDLGRAHRVSQGINAGWIVVNATGRPAEGGPADGAMTVGGLKESGFGVEGGLEGLASYTSQTAVQLMV